MAISRSHAVFTEAIKDAENLLAFFDKLNAKPPPPELEVLKRAGLVMAMTAWETYVEDRVLEAATQRLAGITDSALAEFVRSRMADELKKLHNPSSDKTLKLFADYAGVDVLPQWVWPNMEPQAVRQRLDGYLKLRGGVVHRSRIVVKGPPAPDTVTRDSLQKAIGFLKELVKATEKALGNVE
jgi:hypothetical protein